MAYIINPVSDLSILDSQYERYNNQGYNDKIISNEMSINIYGKKCTEIYNEIRNNIVGDYDFLNMDLIEYYNLKNSTKNDKNFIYEYNKSCKGYCGDIVPYFDPISLDQLYDCNIYSDTPYITKLIDGTDIDIWKNYYSIYCSAGQSKFETIWYKTLRELDRSLSIDKNNAAIKQSMLSLGWNPEVKFNPMNIRLSRTKINNIVSNKSVKYINLYNCINENCNLTDRKFYPIFIVLLYSGTISSKIIKYTTQSIYSHAAISIDPKLSILYSFNANNGSASGGFSIETINSYIQKSKKDGKLYISTILVNKYQYNLIKNIISFYQNNSNKTTYSFPNLLNILRNHYIDSYMQLSMICSEFVDFLLKTADINLTDKSSNLVIPDDFIINNKYIYVLYDDILSNFNINKVHAALNSLHSAEVESCDCIDNYFNINFILNEKSLPIEIDSEGNLNIKTSVDLETEYQRAHRLLLNYEYTGNIEGMKFEVARLFYLNNKAELLLKVTLLQKEKKKEIKDTRARILNDFNKYFKIISATDTTFNFTEYYTNTPFNDQDIKISKYTIEWLMKTVGKIS